MADVVINPAELAAQEALKKMYACIDEGKSFKLEAGAGAGKTYSLIKALTYLIAKKGVHLLRQRQQAACISYTNVASDEIASRIDSHPAIYSSTIHSFCWLMIKDFQPILREKLPLLSNWPERLAEKGGIGTRKINYELGYPTINEEDIFLGHNDVLSLMVALLEYEKFRKLFISRFPILFIDEYQDTDTSIADALKKHFLDTGKGPLIGFFGDHWQKIYGTGCGKIEHPILKFIGKESNFRSVPVIVEVLNRMRPELPQQVKDPNDKGFLAIYNTNNWGGGRRRTGQHWDGDLPAEVAHAYLEALLKHLASEDWDFAPDKTKILMLTHRVLATEQGYNNLAGVFPYNESFIKKEDSYIKFFAETLEPVCVAYENKHFGEMFAVMDSRTPAIRSHTDKASWAKDMDTLLALRSTATIGAVIDHLQKTKRPRLPESIELKERELREPKQNPIPEESSSIERTSNLRKIDYKEVIALTQFIDEKTPFSTKHGVKGAEFENVLVVFGRGWNQYNFNQFLEFAGDQKAIPANKQEFFERNRNLFYVVCSRPKKRLAILFTQMLSDDAMTTLAKWFGAGVIHSL